ncbi:MAG TPA: stage II sporulation protein M [Pyrinomonadaceae bacterium]|nr:stage II sporulation protein M [Pyrinomonadaceae bacterium]
MSSNRFINERKGAWQRLEDLLTLLDRMSLRRLHREEVRELGRIYRRTSSDLAIARAESRDPRLVNYLNSLVIRAHGRIYRAGALEGGARVRRFFTRDFPRAFRRTWRHTAAACAIFMVFFLAGFWGTWRDAEFSALAGISPAWRAQNTEARVRWWETLNEANQVGGAAIMTNNIQVMFYAFAFGALAGLGTLYIMALNGASIGAVLALTYRAGFGHELVAFMAGHGVIEMTCIFIAGGAGLLLGGALLIPGDLSRFDSLRLRGRDSIQLVVGCIPLLVLAGIIEGFISPAPISRLIKFSVAIATGLALYTYLLLAGRGETEAGSTTASRAL